MPVKFCTPKLVLFEETKDYYQGGEHDEGRADKVRLFAMGLTYILTLMVKKIVKRAMPQYTCGREQEIRVTRGKFSK